MAERIAIDAYVDSRAVFNVVAKGGKNMENRLQIDVADLRESHAKGELNNLAWIPGTQNPADGMTKVLVSNNHPLIQLIRSNRLNSTPQGWVSELPSKSR